AGGNALKFYASVRLDVRGAGNVKEGETIIGRDTKVKVVKNKVSPPFRQAQFRLLFGAGIFREGEVLDLAVDAKYILKTGAWYEYQGEKIGQGREKAAGWLRDRPDVVATLTAQLRTHYLQAAL
ncbi:TPA: recombinase RecA, partial [Serratia marcescens]